MFCGGANVGINAHADHIIYNDTNKCLIGLFKIFCKYDYETIKDKVEKIINEFGLSDSSSNGYSYYNCESAEGLSSFNKKPYLDLRDFFNELKQKDENYYLYLFTLIVYGFNNQIRFNSKGEFNLPVGKRDFNSNIKENLRKFVEALHNQKCDFSMNDFRKFTLNDLCEQDFVYCDPPYLITLASYNESKGWLQTDESALLSFLDSLNCNKIKFALSNVIKHKGRTNDLLIHWAEKYNTHILDFNYKNSSYHGKNKNEITQEVLITNY